MPHPRVVEWREQVRSRLARIVDLGELEYPAWPPRPSLLIVQLYVPLPEHDRMPLMLSRPTHSSHPCFSCAVTCENLVRYQ
jgi:hypothetical protein